MTSHLFIHLENRIGGCRRAAEHARGLAAPSEAIRGLVATVVRFPQVGFGYKHAAVRRSGLTVSTILSQTLLFATSISY